MVVFSCMMRKKSARLPPSALLAVDVRAVPSSLDLLLSRVLVERDPDMPVARHRRGDHPRPSLSLPRLPPAAVDAPVRLCSHPRALLAIRAAARGGGVVRARGGSAALAPAHRPPLRPRHSEESWDRTRGAFFSRTAHSAHMSRPILPICHTPLFSHISQFNSVAVESHRTLWSASAGKRKQDSALIHTRPPRGQTSLSTRTHTPSTLTHSPLGRGECTCTERERERERERGREGGREGGRERTKHTTPPPPPPTPTPHPHRLGSLSLAVR